MFCCLKESLSVVKKSKANWSLDTRDSKRRVFFRCIYIMPQLEDHRPPRRQFCPDWHAQHRAHSKLQGLAEMLQSFRDRPEWDDHVSPGTREPPPKSHASILRSNSAARNWIVPALTGGRSTRVIMAASRPRFSTSCNPHCRELNCPRSGSGLTTSEAPRRIHDRRQFELVFPGNHQDDIYMRSEDLDGRGKERFSRAGRWRLGRPGQQRFIFGPCGTIRPQPGLRRKNSKIAPSFEDSKPPHTCQGSH